MAKSKNKPSFRIWLLRCVPAFGSGLLFLVSFPPFGFALATLVALVPWLIQIRDGDPKTGWKRGYALGIWYGSSQLLWAHLFVHRWTGEFLYGFIPYLVCVAMYAVYFGLAGFAMSKCYRSDKTWMIPAVWAGMEVFRSYIPVLAFPWSLLASPLGRFPELIQGAYFGSIFFVTAFLIAVNTLAAEVFGRPKGKTWIWMLAWIAGYAALTFARTSMPKPATTPHKVAIIQPGTDMAFGDQASEFFRLSGKFQQLFPIARSQNPELIIMPEGLVKVPKMPPKPLPFPIPSDASILFGGQRSTKPTYQSSFMYDGTRWQYADKTRLVIFGEYVPFRHLIPSGFNLPAGDLEPSRGGIKQMKGPFGSIGPILCFEALFPDITWQHANADARLIAVMSLDDWFMETPAIEQLRTASVWRAVETGLPVVRVGALGTSMFVEPSGKVTEEVPLMVSAAVTEEIPVPNARASFIGFPAFAIASLLAFLGTLLLPMAAAKYRRKESS